MPRPSYPIEGQGLEQMPPVAPGMPVPGRVQSASVNVIRRTSVIAPVPACMVVMSRLRHSALDAGHGDALDEEVPMP